MSTKTEPMTQERLADLRKYTDRRAWILATRSVSSPNDVDLFNNYRDLLTEIDQLRAALKFQIKQLTVIIYDDDLDQVTENAMLRANLSRAREALGDKS